MKVLFRPLLQGTARESPRAGAHGLSADQGQLAKPGPLRATVQVLQLARLARAPLGPNCPKKQRVA